MRYTRALRLSSKVFANVLGAAAMAVILLSCEELQQKYIRQDKLFKIAFLEDARSRDTLLFTPEFIADPDPEIRARAALAVGRIGDTLSVAFLAANLRDSIFAAAEAKYFAAGLLGHSGLFDSLFYLAEHEPIAREAAVEALGRIADSGQAPHLASFLDDPDTMVVYQAMLALWRAGEWSQAQKIAAVGSSSDSRKVQYGALYALSRGGRNEGRDLFRGFLSDADPEFRMVAVQGLGRIADTTSIKLIAGGLNDIDYRVAAAAMYALGRFESTGSRFIAERIRRLEDEKLLALGVGIIGDHHDFPGAAGVVEWVFRNDARENVRAAAAKSLLQIDGVKALVIIDEVMTSPTAFQKMMLAEGLAAVVPDAAVARLTPLFNDSAPMVRATALESLCAVDSASAERYLATAVIDSDFVVVATAVDLAARRNLTLLIPTIADIYLVKRDRLDDDLKRAIIAAWKTFAADPATDSLVIAALEEGCNDEWFVIRKEASEVLWAKYGRDRRFQVGAARSAIEKTNFRTLFYRYDADPRAVVETSRGTIVIELLYRDAPMTVNNFISLAERGFYDNRVFHRVVPNFVIQDGCPRGDGWGGPGYTIRCEYNRLTYATGMVGMALSGKDTGGSQYFITHSPQPHLDARYTIFGRVISGMDVVQQVVRGDSIKTVTIYYEGGTT